jgi:hypothetical protein
MNKRYLGFVVLLLLPVYAFSEDAYKVVSDALNVRSGPGTEHTVVGSLKNGETVYVIEFVGDWARIANKDGAGEGYVNRNYLDKIAEADDGGMNTADSRPLSVYPLTAILLFIAGVTDANILITLAALGLIIYIAALILSKTTRCVVVFQWWDIIIVAIPGIVLIVSAFVFSGGDGDAGMVSNNLMVNILFFVSLAATFTISVVVNVKYNPMPKSILFSMVAVLAKLFIMILIPLFIILFIAALNSQDNKNRYTRDVNKRTWLIVIVGFISSIMIGSLVKNQNDIH